jgi:hypothetical protein
MKATKDDELSDMIWQVRQQRTDDMGPLLDRFVEKLEEDGLDHDQIHLFLETLIIVDRLPN